MNLNQIIDESLADSKIGLDKSIAERYRKDIHRWVNRKVYGDPQGGEINESYLDHVARLAEAWKNKGTRSLSDLVALL